MARRVGRYLIHGEFAVGGMASVHLGQIVGATGFSRTVAIKQLHPQFAKSSEVCAMLVDEAHLAGRVRHVNVVPILDVVTDDGELFLVMEYVHGESLARLVAAEREAGRAAPCAVACSIARDILRGLHAAHEAKSEKGDALRIVHRDVSPQNVVVGADGVARVLDFGIAKATMRAQTTDGFTLKGKLGYMAPEQLLHGAVDARTDIFAASIVLWEMLAGARLFSGDEILGLRLATLKEPVKRLAGVRSDVSAELDAILARGLALDPAERFASAAEMADALESTVRVGSAAEVGAWASPLARQSLEERARLVAAMESEPSVAIDSPRSPATADVATMTTFAEVAPTQARRPRRWWKWAGAAAAVAIVGFAALIAVFQRGKEAPKRALKVLAVRGAAPVRVSALASVPAAPIEPPASAASSAAPATKRAPPPAARPLKPRSKANCEPPFEYRNGVKTFKSECI